MDPGKIFVGTFTRAVARALAKDLISKEQAAKVEVSTLHALATRLLSKNNKVLKGREMKFLLDYEQDCFLPTEGAQGARPFTATVACGSDNHR